MRFNSKKLLFYKSILQNESITSWICRNALSNYQSPIYFVKPWLNPHKALNYDFDTHPIQELNFWLNSQGRINSFTKEKIDFRIIIKSSFNQAKSKSSAINILGTFKSIKQFPPQFCPSCLNQVEPYFRYEWQFTLLFACDRCNCFLENQCNNCKNPVQLMRLNFFNNNSFKYIYNCAFCYHHLSNVATKRLSQEQKDLNYSIRDILGLIDPPNMNTLKASLLLDLCNYLCFEDAFAAKIRKHFNLTIPKSNFQSLNAIYKYEVIKCAWDWADQFILFTGFFNEEFNLNRKYWESKISIPNFNEVMRD